MNSERTLRKYVKSTFNLDVVDVVYTSSFTAEVHMIDGVIKLLALNNTITVFIDNREFQTLELVNDGFKVVF